MNKIELLPLDPSPISVGGITYLPPPRGRMYYVEISRFYLCILKFYFKIQNNEYFISNLQQIHLELQRC